MSTLTADTKTRYLTVSDSDTNKAHSVWYSELKPMQRLELSSKFDHLNLSPSKKLNACLNYIEDNLAEFTCNDDFHNAVVSVIKESKRDPMDELAVVSKLSDCTLSTKLTEYYINNKVSISKLKYTYSKGN